MALYKYLKPLDSLPDPSGPLSTSMKPSLIEETNKTVRESVTQGLTQGKKRGKYTRLTPEQQASIAEYAAMNGNQAAVNHFSKKLDVDLRVSSVQTWKGKYLAEVSRRRKAGEDISIKSLPIKKRGRPLLLGEKLDSQVQSYIKAVRDGGGMITSAITMATARAIVRNSDRTLLAEYGGPISITKDWAKSLLYRMKFVKRRGSSTAKMTVSNFEALKEQFLIDVKSVVDMEDIPAELVFNWDQTGISIVPGSSWTMEAKGSKRVEIVGIGDKRQITAVLCGTLTGKFLPPQIIYQGKTKACLPHFSFPNDWHVTFTPNHWSNEEKMKEYIQVVVVPYVTRKRQELKLSSDHAALAIFDVFRGQQTDAVMQLLEKNNILVVNIPSNCTDRLQPMDLSVNKCVKEFMRSKFSEWYSDQVKAQLNDAESVSPVDLKMSTMKPLGARWLVSLYDYICENNSIVESGFKAAGLLF